MCFDSRRERPPGPERDGAFERRRAGARREEREERGCAGRRRAGRRDAGDVPESWRIEPVGMGERRGRDGRRRTGSAPSAPGRSPARIGCIRAAAPGARDPSRSRGAQRHRSSPRRPSGCPGRTSRRAPARAESAARWRRIAGFHALAGRLACSHAISADRSGREWSEAGRSGASRPAVTPDVPRGRGGTGGRRGPSAWPPHRCPPYRRSRVGLVDLRGSSPAGGLSPAVARAVSREAPARPVRARLHALARP